MRGFGILVAASLLVAACQSAQERVYAIQAGYTAGLSLAVDYESLPRCAPGVTLGCSEPGVVDALRRADNIAAPAILEAQRVVRDPSSSTSDVSLALNSARAALDLLQARLKEVK